MNLLAVLNEIHQEVTPLLGQGKVAEYIPELAKVDPMQFGMAFALLLAAASTACGRSMITGP